MCHQKTRTLTRYNTLKVCVTEVFYMGRHVTLAWQHKKRLQLLVTESIISIHLSLSSCGSEWASTNTRSVCCSTKLYGGEQITYRLADGTPTLTLLLSRKRYSPRQIMEEVRSACKNMSPNEPPSWMGVPTKNFKNDILGGTCKKTIIVWRLWWKSAYIPCSAETNI